jgi:hypothetical protein
LEEWTVNATAVSTGALNAVVMGVIAGYRSRELLSVT